MNISVCPAEVTKVPPSGFNSQDSLKFPNQIKLPSLSISTVPYPSVNKLLIFAPTFFAQSTSPGVEYFIKNILIPLPLEESVIPFPKFIVPVNAPVT